MTERAPLPQPGASLGYQHRRPRPLWVRSALYGLPSRGWVIAFLCLSLGIAVAGPVLAIVMDRPRWWIWAGMVLAAGWYWKALRWVDRNDQWG